MTVNLCPVGAFVQQVELLAVVHNQTVLSGDFPLGVADHNVRRSIGRPLRADDYLLLVEGESLSLARALNSFKHPSL